MGQQYLYNKLKVIPANSDGVELSEKIITRFTNDENFRLKVQTQLELLNKDEVYDLSSLFQAENQQPPKWFIVIKLLSFTMLLSLVLMPFQPQLIFLSLGVFIANVAIHYSNKRNLYKYLGSIPQLLRLNNIAVFLLKDSELGKIKPDLASSIKVLSEVKSRMSFFQLEAKIQGDFEAVFWGMLEFFKTLFLLEPLLLFGVLKRLDTRRVEIEEVFAFVGEVDCLVSVALMRAGLKSFIVPDIIEKEGRISVSKMYHPLIANCVTNNVRVDEKSVLLTGSNMTGKTSFIRAIGVNVITGLTLNTCFAQHISIPRAKVYLTIS